MNVISARRPSPQVLPSHGTGEYILGRSPMSAVPVGRLSMTPQPSGVTQDACVYTNICMYVHTFIYVLVCIHSLCEEKQYLTFHVLKLSFQPFFSTHSLCVLQIVLDYCLGYVPLNFSVDFILQGASFPESKSGLLLSKVRETFQLHQTTDFLLFFFGCCSFV